MLFSGQALLWVSVTFVNKLLMQEEVWYREVPLAWQLNAIPHGAVSFCQV